MTTLETISLLTKAANAIKNRKKAWQNKRDECVGAIVICRAEIWRYEDKIEQLKQQLPDVEVVEEQGPK